MARKDKPNADPLPWLLEEAAPGVRYLALRDLVEPKASSTHLRLAQQLAHTHGPIAAILDKMNADGYWVQPGPGYNPKYRSTVWALILLAQLGASINLDKRIAQACTYVLDQALSTGGQFTASGAPSGTADCLQGNLCWALVELGCTDPRLETAFEWMARSVTGEGIASIKDRSAAVRYYAGKCGPGFACGANNKLPCAWGAAKVMQAFSAWPVNRQTPLIKRAIKQGVDFLFSSDPVKAKYPTGYSTKPSGNWWKFGFPVFYVTDILQIAEALVRLGYGGDRRLKNTLAYIREKQNEQGQWLLDYDYKGKTWLDFGAKAQPNKWVTLRAFRVLLAIA